MLQETFSAVRLSKIDFMWMGYPSLTQAKGSLEGLFVLPPLEAE